MLLLLAQSWSAGYRQMAFHRKLGLATFVAMPLFAAGSMGVIRSMAFGTAHGDLFYALWGAPLAGFEMMSLTGAGRAAYGALGNSRWRRCSRPDWRRAGSPSWSAGSHR